MTPDNNISRREFCRRIFTAGLTWTFLSATESNFAHLAPLLSNPAEYFSFGLEMSPVYFAQVSREPKNRIIMGQIKSEIAGKRPDSVRDLLQLAYEKAIMVQAEDPAREALRSLAGLSYLSPDQVTRHFPLYLPDGRPQNPGVDKAGHFFISAMYAYEMMKQVQEGGQLFAGRFAISSLAIIDLVGNDNLEMIANHLSADPRRSFPFPSSKILGLSSIEQSITGLLFKCGLAYEALTSARKIKEHHNSELSLRNALPWLGYRLEGRANRIKQEIETVLKNSSPFVVRGLGDEGVNGDITANIMGTVWGIWARRMMYDQGQIIAFPAIPYDDYSEKFGHWQGSVNSKGWTDNPPSAYPRPERPDLFTI